MFIARIFGFKTSLLFSFCTEIDGHRHLCFSVSPPKSSLFTSPDGVMQLSSAAAEMSLSQSRVSLGCHSFRFRYCQDRHERTDFTGYRYFPGYPDTFALTASGACGTAAATDAADAETSSATATNWSCRSDRYFYRHCRIFLFHYFIGNRQIKILFFRVGLSRRLEGSPKKHPVRPVRYSQLAIIPRLQLYLFAKLSFHE